MYKNIINLYLEIKFFHPYYNFNSERAAIKYNITEYNYLCSLLINKDDKSDLFYSFIELLIKCGFSNYDTMVGWTAKIARFLLRSNKQYNKIKLNYDRKLNIHRNIYKKIIKSENMSKYNKDDLVGKTLYKIDARNKMRVWKITKIEENDDLTANWAFEFGLYKKKMIQRNIHVPDHNTRHDSCFEQAVVKACSKFTKMLKDGYAVSIKDSKIKKKIDRPMQTTNYNTKSIRESIKFPIYVQKKFDGVFVKIQKIDNKITYHSSSMKEIKSLDHIDADVDKIYDYIRNRYKRKNQNVKLSNNYRFVGEIYVHGVERAIISGLTNRDESTSETSILEIRLFEMYIYDKKYEYTVRTKYLQNMKKVITKDLTKIQIVKEAFVKTQEMMDKLLANAIKNGYEGIIIRNPKGIYEHGKRSKNLIKRKVWDDDICKLTDVLLASTDNKDVYGIKLVCVSERFGDKKIIINGSGTEEYRRNIYNNRAEYIGKKLRYKYYGIQSGSPGNCKPSMKNNKYEFQD